MDGSGEGSIGVIVDDCWYTAGDRGAEHAVSRPVAEIGEARIASHPWLAALLALSSCSVIEDSSVTSNVL